MPGSRGSARAATARAAVSRGGVLGPVLALALLAGAPANARAQTLEAVEDACVVAGGDADACTVAAVAARSLAGHLGTLSAFGSHVPGTASTVGSRIGSAPRVSASLRAGGLNAGLPDVTDPSGTTESRFFAPVVHLGVAAGVFDGFSPMPTVGGLLSLDLFGQAGFLSLPRDDGFSGGVRVLALGARVGILRESFTLPGVSVSVARHWPQRVRLDGPDPDEPVGLVLDAAITSVRMTVGKDLFGVGVLAGAGWDDHSADATLRVSDGGTGRAVAQGVLEADRRSYFVGASKSFIVVQMSAEAGWVHGFGPVEPLTDTAFDPAGGSLFGSVALRFTP